MHSTHIIVVGEVQLGTHEAHVELVVDPALSQPGVKDGRLVARIGADEQAQVGVLDSGYPRVQQVVRPKAEIWAKSNLQQHRKA